MRRAWDRPLLLAFSAAWLVAPAARAQTDTLAHPGAAGEGVYTAEQASRGETTFRRICAACHVASQFSAASFRRSWSGRSVFELFELIRTTMPLDNPGRLRRPEYAEVLAYVFRMNGAPAGTTPLAADRDSLERVLVPLVPGPRP